MNAVPAANLVGITGIARRLVLDGALDESSAREALEAATRERKPISNYLRDNRLVTSAQMAAANSIEFGMPVFDPASMDGTQSAIRLVKDELLAKHNVLPLFKRGGKLFVGMADPTNSHALDELKFHTNLTVEPILVDEDKIRRIAELWLESHDALGDTLGDGDGMDNLDVSGGDDDIADDRGVDGKGDDTPVVKFVNKVLIDAIKKGASDIHFEPYENDYRVRLRIDGILKQVAKMPVKLNQRITARLKVMAQLDIAEKRVPQDGRIKLNLSKTKQIDFRVSTLPTLFGEKVVLRILDAQRRQAWASTSSVTRPTSRSCSSMRSSGLMAWCWSPVRPVRARPSRCTPRSTSSTTSSATSPRSRIRSKSACPASTRCSMNVKRGMTFAAALRSFLRQDPDVIMVGEIRDLETAEIAIKAAQTGHMVLSTLHTNDAPQTIARLMNMGIAPYNITSSVTLVIAQRLARRLHDCKREIQIPEHALLAEGFTADEVHAGIKTYDAVGCADCTEGYKGRVGIYQVMPMSEDIQAIILEGGNAMQIAEAAKKAGVRDLRRSALDKVKNGLTSLAEINRVTKD